MYAYVHVAKIGYNSVNTHVLRTLHNTLYTRTYTLGDTYAYTHTHNRILTALTYI